MTKVKPVTVTDNNSPNQLESPSHLSLETAQPSVRETQTQTPNSPNSLTLLLLFLILPFLAFPEIIFGGQTLYWSDLSWIHYPRHIFAAAEWLAGRPPLWDPYQHTGLPFLAESQVSALYPFSLLFLSPLSPSLELSLFILLHYTLAALFTFILVRSLGLGRFAAAVAGLAFGFGGFLMAQVANLNIMTGAVWLPLILYGVIRAVKNRSLRTAMLAGIPLAFQIFTAQPQVVFYTLVTLAGYAVYRIGAHLILARNSSQAKILPAGQVLLLVAVAVITGLLLAAPQLLPTLELQQHSVRSEERGFDFLTENSLPPIMLLNLLIPSAFGNNVTGFKGGDPFQEDFIYIGLIPLLLVFFGLSRPWRRDQLFFVGLLLAGLLLAFGRYTPLYTYLIQYLPGFALFRIPARWLMVVNLALAVLAGFGLDKLLRRGLSKSSLILILSAGIGLIVALGLGWNYGDTLQQWSAGRWPERYQKLLAAFLDKGYTVEPLYSQRWLFGWQAALTAPAFLLLVNIILLLILFGLFAARKVRPAAFGWLLIAAISLDLVAAGGTTINPTRPAAWWHQLSAGGQYVVDNLDEGRVFPLGMGSEELTVSHLGQYFPSVYRIRSAGGHGSSLMLARLSRFLEQAHPVQAIQLLGVRYLLTEGQMGADVAAAYPLAYSDEQAFVYENKSPLPRAFIIHDVIRVETLDQALSHFEGVTFDPARTAVLEASAELPDLLPDLNERVGSSSTGSAAAIVAENPQQIEIEVNAAADGYLLLLDMYYPGWTAALDGQDTPIYPANVIGRAVFVPAGEHRVIFRYQPWPFRLGLWLAAGTVLFLTVSLLKKV